MVISLLNISYPLAVQCWDMKEQLRAQTIGHFRDLCIKTRLSAQPLIRKWLFILMQIKLIFTRKVVLLASFWKWGFLELGSGLLQCDYNNRSQFYYSIHLVRCNFFKLLKAGLPLSKRFLKLSISFTNCAIFHEKLGFEVNYAKSQHRRISEALQRKWSHLMLFPSSFETRELFRWMNHWKQQETSDYESISVSSQNRQHEGNTFFPNGGNF